MTTSAVFQDSRRASSHGLGAWRSFSSSLKVCVVVSSNTKRAASPRPLLLMQQCPWEHLLQRTDEHRSQFRRRGPPLHAPFARGVRCARVTSSNENIATAGLPYVCASECRTDRKVTLAGNHDALGRPLDQTTFKNTSTLPDQAVLGQSGTLRAPAVTSSQAPFSLARRGLP